jgi:carbamoyltransferase
MIVLGLNLKHGDASACIIKDGKLLSAAEEERFTRVKHCSHFPINSINFCLKQNNISIDEVDYIAHNSSWFYNFFPRVIFFSKHIIKYISWKKFLEFYSKNNYIKRNFFLYFNSKLDKKIVSVPHHLAHIFSTMFFLEDNKNALIFSFDGSGDFSTSESYLIKEKKIKFVEKNYFPHSYGFLYTAFSQFLGFSKYGDEYKVMGLAGYGKPIYENKIKKILKNLTPLELELKYFNIPTLDYSKHIPVINRLYNQKFINLFGNPRNENEEDSIDQEHKDLAASLQKVFEDMVLNHLTILKQKYGCNKLYLTGGCALNGLLAGKIIEAGLFESVSVGTNPGDAGGAIGSAFFLLHSKNEKIDPIQNTTFLGPGFNNEYIKKNIIDKIQEQNKYKIKFYENFDDLAAEAALIIKKEKIIFWFQDNMEWGPRALGNRSILADPSSKNIKNLLNSKIKKRELFRPFAPAVMEEFASDYFYMNNHKSPFMNIVFKARENTKNSLPGIVHVDGTSRVQTVGEGDNKKFYKLLQEFNKISNCPILINTSLNINEPIALSPADAFQFFLEAEIKCIVLNNWIIELKH